VSLPGSMNSAGNGRKPAKAHAVQQDRRYLNGVTMQNRLRRAREKFNEALSNQPFSFNVENGPSLAAAVGTIRDSHTLSDARFSCRELRPFPRTEQIRPPGNEKSP